MRGACGQFADGRESFRPGQTVALFQQGMSGVANFLFQQLGVVFVLFLEFGQADDEPIVIIEERLQHGFDIDGFDRLHFAFD